MKNINEFLWWCSGTDKQLLKKTPSESAKYFGIGGMVFFTGVFAAISSGYAFNFVFSNMLTSTLLGIVWGLMIFNLDRYVVSGMKKRFSTLREISIATPRFVLAVVIAIVISKPLELKIFEREINTELEVIQLEKQAALDSAVDRRYENLINNIQLENQRLTEAVTEKEKTRDQLRDMARQEADGTGGTRQRNAGPIYKIKKENADKAEEELEKLRASADLKAHKNEAILDSLQNRIALEKSANSAEWNGLAGRLDALSRLTLKSDAIYWANLFIVLLFILIETAPVIVKLIAEKGPYDYLSMENDFNFKSDSLYSISLKREGTLKKAKNLSEPEFNLLKSRLQKEV